MLDWERERDGIVVVVAVGLAVLFADQLRTALVFARDWGPVVLGLGAVVLGAGIGYRAWRRREPGGAATPVLERRADLLAAETAPQVTVVSWAVEDDELVVELANVGNGAATDLTAVVEVGDLAARTRLRAEGAASTLAPDGRETFRAEPVFRGEPDGEATVGVYSAVAGRLAGRGPLPLVVAVEYTGPTGETERRRVWAATVDPGASLEATADDGRDAVDAEGLPPGE